MRLSSLLGIFEETSHSFEGQEKDEKVVLLLRRHPFTILLPVSILVTVKLVPIAVLILFYPFIDNHSLITPFFFLSSIYYSATWLVMFYLLTMYSLNTVIITDRRVMDREQKGFFNRKVSELHNYRIQDVSVYVKGIIETFLHFGTVTIQTAGSEKEFVFPHIANPDEVKNTIMKTATYSRSGVKASSEAVNNLATEP